MVSKSLLVFTAVGFAALAPPASAVHITSVPGVVCAPVEPQRDGVHFNHAQGALRNVGDPTDPNQSFWAACPLPERVPGRRVFEVRALLSDEALRNAPGCFLSKSTLGPATTVPAAAVRRVAEITTVTFVPDPPGSLGGFATVLCLLLPGMEVSGIQLFHE